MTDMTMTTKNFDKAMSDVNEKLSGFDFATNPAYDAVPTWHDAVPEDGPVFPAPAPTPAAPATFLRTVTVTVKPIHIVNGVPGNVFIDPVGLAIKDAVPFSRQVRVSTVDIGFTIGTPKNTTVEHTRYIVETPAEVAAWVTRFDAKKDVRPFSFELSWTEVE